MSYDEHEGLLKAWRARDAARLERMEEIADKEREKYEAAKQIQLTLFPRGQW